MRLGVVVLNFNGSSDTAACLDSLVDQLGREDCVVVVDNCSRPDDRDRLVANVPGRADERIDVLLSPANLGFAGGNNFGLRHLAQRGFDYALLLNNDTVLEPGALEALVSGARASSADLAGPKILYHDHPETIWHGAGRFSRLRQGPVVVEHRRLDTGDEAPTEAAFLTGCALLISRRAYEEVGQLDEGYFFYFEDWDYCFRTARRGLRLAYIPAARILHKVSRSSGGWSNAFSLYHQGRGRARFLRKHLRGWRTAGGFAYLLTAVTAMKAAQILTSPGPRLPRLEAWLRGCLDLPPANDSRAPTSSATGP